MKTVIDAVNELKGDIENSSYCSRDKVVLLECVINGSSWDRGLIVADDDNYTPEAFEEICTVDEFNDMVYEMSEWRPHLPSIPTETKEEKEALDKIDHNMLRPRDGAHDPIKPVYTQAMQDAGELPPVGSEAQFFSEGYDDEWFDWCIFHGLATCGGYIIEHHHRTSPSRVAVVLFDPLTTSFKPIQTEREKSIEALREVILEQQLYGDADGYLKLSTALYDAGYRLQST